MCSFHCCNKKNSTTERAHLISVDKNRNACLWCHSQSYSFATAFNFFDRMVSKIRLFNLAPVDDVIGWTADVKAFLSTVVKSPACVVVERIIQSDNPDDELVMNSSLMMPTSSAKEAIQFCSAALLLLCFVLNPSSVPPLPLTN